MQRWNIIKKRKRNSSLPGGEGNSTLGGKGNSSSGGGAQLSEAQLAARRAMSLALNMPLTDKLMASSSRVGGTSNMNQNEKSKADGAQQRTVVLGLSSQSLVNSKAHSTKSTDEMVKATAVAAGARIGNPCEAMLLKNNGSSLPSNVHYIRTGLASTTQSTSSSALNDPRQIQKPAGATKKLEGILPNSVDGGQVPVDRD
uniref:Uncharacterized protein n=1 Tax=Daucus carota subsp. sativus TaxID=79200 RepID=A0A165Z9R8_DAUCS